MNKGQQAGNKNRTYADGYKAGLMEAAAICEANAKAQTDSSIKWHYGAMARKFNSLIVKYS